MILLTQKKQPLLRGTATPGCGNRMFVSNNCYVWVKDTQLLAVNENNNFNGGAHLFSDAKVFGFSFTYKLSTCLNMFNDLLS